MYVYVYVCTINYNIPLIVMIIIMIIMRTFPRVTETNSFHGMVHPLMVIIVITQARTQARLVRV